MREKKKEKKVDRRRAVFWISVGAILAVIWICLSFSLDISSTQAPLDGIDDQRSTLWPVLISIILTMLGSLITTYVFLKEALDRTVDERPYYSSVIKEYRDRIMGFLWYYAVISFLLIGLVILIYGMLYFMNRRVLAVHRIMIIIFYMACMVVSVVFLHRCIDINRGLSNAAEQLMKERMADAEKFISDKQMNGFAEKMFHRYLAGKEKNAETLMCWLEINDNRYLNIADKKKFISIFSEWEKILMMLVENGKGFLHEQSVNERMKIAVLDGEKIFCIKNMEEDDAEANAWNEGAYIKIKELQEALKIGAEDFYEIYELLSEYRNLLQVQMETGKNSRKDKSSHIEEGNRELEELFFIFLVQMSSKIFRILPKIEVFLPGRKFQFANFYSTRFENSAFRSSAFEHSIFSRSKMDNSNFGMAGFCNCVFFSADFRNCSLSNTLFETCDIREAIFENVDFTGTILKECDLNRTEWKDSILSNMELEKVKFYKNGFANSKIWDITLSDIPGWNIRECDFSDSDLHHIRLFVKEEEAGVSCKEESKEIKAYIELLNNRAIREYYWGDARTETEIRSLFDTFILEGSFSQSVITDQKKFKKTPEELVLWTCIRENAVIKMNECNFENALMSEARFYRSDLSQSIFRNTQMDGSHLVSIYMPGCIMSGVKLRGSILWAVHMQSAVLDDAILFGAKCKMVNLQDAMLKNLHASEASVVYCLFDRSDCSFIDLTKAKIIDSSFRDSILTGAELTNAELKKINFENSIANNMLSSYSIFENCNMKNAFLRQSSFNYTVFINCDFSLANFSESTVTNAEFHNCNFQDSNFRNTCFINTYFKDNRHIEQEIFEGCQFINPIFEGENT